MRLRNAVLAALAMVQFGGCAVGSGEFSCPDVPDGIACTSTREVYERTEGMNPRLKSADEQQAEADGDDDDEEAGGNGRAAGSRDAAGDRAADDSDPSGDGAAAQPAVRAPVRQRREIPIREPAQVMRIWVAPWEDQSGNLHMSGLIYTEVVERRWAIGEPAATDSGITQPLTAPGAPNPERATPETESTREEQPDPAAPSAGEIESPANDRSE